MPQKSKSRSKSQKKRAATPKPTKKVIKKAKSKKPSKPSKNEHKTRQNSKSKSLSRVTKKPKTSRVPPVKKKITKAKKKQPKKKSIVKSKSPIKSVSKSSEKQQTQKQKVEQLQKKSIAKEKSSKSKEKSVGKSQSKKKEKSYFDILYDYITADDKQYESQPKPIQSEKKPYQLMEDIKIIYSVAQDDKHEGLGPVFWNELANKKIIQRPVESMRDRYKRYIRFLDKNDFDKIITYLKEQGTEGYMIFSKGEDGNRKLINIQSQDPLIKIDLQEQQSEGLPKPKEQKSLESLHNILQKRQDFKGKKPQITSKIEEKLFPIASEAMSQSFKKLVVQAARPIIKSNEVLLSSALLEELPMMKQVQNQAMKSLECISQTQYKIYTNFAKITDVKDLNSVVNMLHFQFGKTRQEIIDDLQDVNGNIQSLIQIYQNPAENIHLKWTNEDDNILKQCKTKEDISLKLLVRYKGEESVRNRIKFRKLVLPFTI